MTVSAPLELRGRGDEGRHRLGELAAVLHDPGVSRQKRPIEALDRGALVSPGKVAVSCGFQNGSQGSAHGHHKTVMNVTSLYLLITTSICRVDRLCCYTLQELAMEPEKPLGPFKENRPSICPSSGSIVNQFCATLVTLFSCQLSWRSLGRESQLLEKGDEGRR